MNSEEEEFRRIEREALRQSHQSKGTSMKEKTKELADSVGAVYPSLFLGRHDGVLFTETELETFVELVAAAEREACEMAVEDIARKYQKAHEVSAENVADACAYAIRARGENT